ncbi:hypothetical protein EJ06DRAFT_257677 [Trichodelitschia bisporula]|uniref:Uncharacterized protein n=1 Tax=Trichodelitschia bisporula TaxID=703511 RepID=A0A6G1HJ58_9PEZI|nr:hypothetical protein EJ06DRAFT_257677 [Trichodelitschia bisporula]
MRDQQKRHCITSWTEVYTASQYSQLIRRTHYTFKPSSPHSLMALNLSSSAPDEMAEKIMYPFLFIMASIVAVIILRGARHLPGPKKDLAWLMYVVAAEFLILGFIPLALSPYLSLLARCAAACCFPLFVALEFRFCILPGSRALQMMNERNVAGFLHPEAAPQLRRRDDIRRFRRRHRPKARVFMPWMRNEPR